MVKTGAKALFVGMVAVLLAGVPMAFASNDHISSVAAGTQSPNPVVVGNSATYPISFGVTHGSGSGTDSITLSVLSGMPTGASALFSPNPVSVTATSTLTITTTSSTPVGTYNLVVKAVANTSVTVTSTAVLVVSKNSVTPSVTASNKVYDATNAATISNCSLSGVLLADAGNVTCSATSATFNNVNVGSGKVVSATGIVLGGSAASKYQLSSATATTTANVTTRPITVTAATNTKVYDSTTSAAATPTVTAGTLAGTDTGNFTETYSTTSVGTGKTLTPAGSVNDGNGGNNYSITFANNTTGVITARPITVAADAKSKTYGDADPAFTYHVTSGSLVGSDAFSGSLTRAAGEAAGTYAIQQGSLTLGSNYAITFTGANLTIGKATLTATADNKTIAFGSPDPTFTISYTGFKFTDNASGLATPPTASVTVPHVNSGSYPIVVAGGSDTNYTFNLVNGTLTIGKEDQTITVNTHAPATAVYNSTFTVAATAGSGLTVSYSSTGSCSNTGATFTMTSGSGTCTVHYNQAGNGNFNAAPEVTEAVTAQQRALTVSGVTASNKTYDGTTDATLNTGSAALVGVVSPDHVNFHANGATGTFSDKNVGTGKTVVVSGLSINGPDSGNYTLTQPTTTANITTRPITVTAATNTKIFDGTTSAAASPTITAGSLASGDTGNFTETYDTANVGSGKTLIPAGSVNDGNAGNNYAITFANNTTGAIGPSSAATVTLSGLNQTYDGTPKSATVNTNPSGLATSVTYNGSSTAPTPAGNYSVVATITDPNYSGSATGTLVIASASQTITFNTLADKTLGDADFPVNATSTSGLDVTFTADPSGTCTIVPTNTVHLVGTGTCTITAHQSGSTNFGAAADVARSFTVNSAAPVVAPTSTLSITVSGLQNTDQATLTVTDNTTSTLSAATTTGNATLPFTLNTGDSYSVDATTTAPNYTITNSCGSGTLNANASCTIVFATSTAPAPAATTSTVSIAPSTGLSSGQVSVAYSSGDITASNSANATDTFTWTETGALPSGLVFGSSDTTSTVTGTPNATGTFPFSVTATSNSDNTQSSTVSYTITIDPAPVPPPNPTSTLSIAFAVDNTGGGTATPSDFTIIVTAGNPNPASFLGTLSTTSVTIDANHFFSASVSSSIANYNTLTNGSCTDPSGIIPGGIVNCSITETFVPPAPAPTPTQNPTSEGTIVSVGPLAPAGSGAGTGTGNGGGSVGGGAVLGASTTNPVYQLALLQKQLITLEFKTNQCSLVFSRNLGQGMTDPQVKNLQTVLNYTPLTQVASTGAGSPGNETTHFGNSTKEAVINFQDIFAAEILTPNGFNAGTGYVGPLTRAVLNNLCSQGQ